MGRQHQRHRPQIERLAGVHGQPRHKQRLALPDHAAQAVEAGVGFFVKTVVQQRGGHGCVQRGLGRQAHGRRAFVVDDGG